MLLKFVWLPQLVPDPGMTGDHLGAMTNSRATKSTTKRSQAWIWAIEIGWVSRKGCLGGKQTLAWEGLANAQWWPTRLPIKPTAGKRNRMSPSSICFSPLETKIIFPVVIDSLSNQQGKITNILLTKWKSLQRGAGGGGTPFLHALHEFVQHVPVVLGQAGQLQARLRHRRFVVLLVSQTALILGYLPFPLFPGILLSRERPAFGENDG